MYYFPVHLMLELNSSIHSKDTSVLLNGTTSSHGIDFNNFNICNINPELIKGQSFNQKVYSRPIKQITLVDEQEDSYGLDQIGISIKCGWRGNVIIVFEDDRDLVIKTGSVNENDSVLMNQRSEEIHLLVCYDEPYPHTFYFGVVTQGWLDKYCLEQLDSK